MQIPLRPMNPTRNIDNATVAIERTVNPLLPIVSRIVEAGLLNNSPIRFNIGHLETILKRDHVARRMITVALGRDIRIQHKSFAKFKVVSGSSCSLRLRSPRI